MILEFREWLVESAGHTYLSPEAYRDRMERVGFKAERNGSHWQLYHPSGIIDGFSENLDNWSGKQNWRLKRQDVRKALSKAGIPPTNLDFVWQNPFVIPMNFDIQTLQFREKPEGQIIVIGPAMDPEGFEGKQIRIGGVWQPISMAGHGGRGIEFMTTNGSVIPIRYGTKLEVK